MTNWDSSQGCKGGTILQIKKYNTSHKQKDISHMIISIDVEKAFGKVQHSFMIKNIHQVGVQGAFLNIMKAIYERPTAKIALPSKDII